jgi:hypothetical protein
MHYAQQEYRLISDQKVKVAEYRTYWILGKSLVLLLLSISIPMVYGLKGVTSRFGGSSLFRHFCSSRFFGKVFRHSVDALIARREWYRSRRLGR